MDNTTRFPICRNCHRYRPYTWQRSYDCCQRCHCKRWHLCARNNQETFEGARNCRKSSPISLYGRLRIFYPNKPMFSDKDDLVVYSQSSTYVFCWLTPTAIVMAPIAGGAYVPAMSDETIIVRNQGTIFCGSSL